MSFSLRCTEGGGSTLASLGACSRRREEDLSLEEPLFFIKNLPKLLPGSLDGGVSNKVVPSDGCSSTSRSLLL